MAKVKVKAHHRGKSEVKSYWRGLNAFGFDKEWIHPDDKPAATGKAEVAKIKGQFDAQRRAEGKPVFEKRHKHKHH